MTEKLEWDEVAPDVHCTYSLEAFPDSNWRIRRRDRDGQGPWVAEMVTSPRNVWLGECLSLEGAKAVCQAHYEERLQLLAMAALGRAQEAGKIFLKAVREYVAFRDRPHPALSELSNLKFDLEDAGRNADGRVMEAICSTLLFCVELEQADQD